MFKKKIVAIITLAMLVISMLAVPVSAQEASDLTVVGKLAVIEKTIYGATQTGALLERVAKIETDVYGQETTEAVLPRVDKLYTHTVQTSEQAPAMITKVNAVEWMFTHSISNQPLKTRIENLERSLNGSPTTGALEERLTKLLKIAYTDGQFEVVSTNIAKDSLVKIKTLSTLNSKKSRTGDSVALAVAEDVVIGGVLVLPKGAKGTGKITKIENAGNFGRDAKIEVSFDTIEGVDGTAINTFLGEKAKEETKSMAKAAGASVAGMIILGPVGIIGGAFVNGSEANIPIGTQMYIQTKADTEVYGIRVK